MSWFQAFAFTDATCTATQRARAEKILAMQEEKAKETAN
jgi:hypothetical protein